MEYIGDTCSSTAQAAAAAAADAVVTASTTTTNTAANIEVIANSTFTNIYSLLTDGFNKFIFFKFHFVNQSIQYLSQYEIFNEIKEKIIRNTTTVGTNYVTGSFPYYHLPTITINQTRLHDLIQQFQDLPFLQKGILFGIFLFFLPIIQVIVIGIVSMVYRIVKQIVHSCFLIMARIYMVYTGFNIVFDLMIVISLSVSLILRRVIPQLIHRPTKLRRELEKCDSYDDYMKTAIMIEEAEGLIGWKNDVSDFKQATMLSRTMDEIDQAIQMVKEGKDDDLEDLKSLLKGLLRRNHLSIDDKSIHTKCLTGTKTLINDYQAKVIEGINFIADSKKIMKNEKVSFLKECRRALGRSALCLSGGGSITMHHHGIVKGLIDHGLYDDIKVITGCSGGSILASLCAIHTKEELLEQVLIPEFCTDFKKDGTMARKNLKWFFHPPDVLQWLKNGVALSNDDFVNSAKHYFGDITFQEAFSQTKKHVNISISASAVAGFSGMDELLLNHLTTPNVLIRSAVGCSCSLPGVLKPSKLLYKDTRGYVAPFELNGVEWIDGSVQADIPFQGVSTMFCVSNFIVSQVNFHVVPFIKEEHVNNNQSFIWKLLKAIMLDIRHRIMLTAELDLFPKVYGQDLISVFNQSYHGPCTITPNFRLLEYLGTKAILTPGKEEMKYYIHEGEKSIWREMKFIEHITEFERHLLYTLNNVKSSNKGIKNRKKKLVNNIDECACTSPAAGLGTLTNSGSFFAPEPDNKFFKTGINKSFTIDAMIDDYANECSDADSEYSETDRLHDNEVNDTNDTTISDSLQVEADDEDDDNLVDVEFQIMDKHELQNSLKAKKINKFADKWKQSTNFKKRSLSHLRSSSSSSCGSNSSSNLPSVIENTSVDNSSSAVKDDGVGVGIGLIRPSDGFLPSVSRSESFAADSFDSTDGIVQRLKVLRDRQAKIDEEKSKNSREIMKWNQLLKSRQGDAINHKHTYFSENQTKDYPTPFYGSRLDSQETINMNVPIVPTTVSPTKKYENSTTKATFAPVKITLQDVPDDNGDNDKSLNEESNNSNKHNNLKHSYSRSSSIASKPKPDRLLEKITEEIDCPEESVSEDDDDFDIPIPKRLFLKSRSNTINNSIDDEGALIW